MTRQIDRLECFKFVKLPTAITCNLNFRFQVR